MQSILLLPYVEAQDSKIQNFCLIALFFEKQ